MWTVLEQVGIAALDAGAEPLAASVVAAVKAQFPDSKRADRLAVRRSQGGAGELWGLCSRPVPSFARWHAQTRHSHATTTLKPDPQSAYLESIGATDDAAVLVTAGLEEAPDSAVLAKRKVAALRGAGDLGGAIAALAAHVDAFQTDGDAWGELGDLYLEASQPGQAAFCYEEALLHLPASAAAQCRVADSLATTVGPAAAAPHYAAAVALSGGKDVRAMYGLLACAAGGRRGGRAGANGTADGGAPLPGEPSTADLAAATLTRIYADKASPALQALLRTFLERNGLVPGSSGLVGGKQ